MPSRTRVVWQWEDDDDDGQGVGPVWVDTFQGDSQKPDKSEEWDHWVRRSVAERFAAENGFEFLADA
jgi:hypothetical protein